MVAPLKKTIQSIHYLRLLSLGLITIRLVSTLKEFSLARYDESSYANNSVIDINLVGEGFEGSQITDGGALECHTDDTTCCRGIDNPNGGGRGEWYYPNGTVVPPPGGGTGFYRTRDNMVLRLNRGPGTLSPIGVYTCVIPGAGGVSITRYITLGHWSLCNDLPDVSNQAVTYSPSHEVSGNLPIGQRYTGTIATYRCSLGYQLIGGSSLRACGPNGTWNGTSPSCVVDCGELAPPDNVQVDTSSGTTFNQTATYSCNVGYNIRGPLTSICGSDGMWSPMKTTCEPVECGPLTNATNGQVNTSSGTTFESTATYTCNTGYTLSGSSSRTCRADGMWTSSQPECELVDCGHLTDPTNGQVDTSSGTTFESTATYTCNTGYTLSGSSSRTCGADRIWTSSQPECEAVDCGPLSDPTDGQVDTSSGTTFESTATYTCNTGHTLSGSSSRICGADGMWTSSQPECELVDCGPLTDPTNGQVDTSSGSTFESTATYTCNIGYTLSGSSSRTCGVDGMWSLEEPTCEPVDCGPLTDPTNGQVDTSSGTTFESTATYTCNIGYNLIGLSSRTCGAEGMWTPVEPSCELVVVQIRLERISGCTEYSSINTLQKIEDISSAVTENVIRLCSCLINSSILLNSRLRCFVNSPHIVTFRTQLSETSQTSFVELVSYIEQWIGSSEGLVVNGLQLMFQRDCPLVVSRFDSEECPSSPETDDIGAIVGGITAAVVLFILVVVIVVIIMCVYIKRRQSKTTESSVNRTEVELQQTGQQVKSSDTDQAYEIVESPAVPVEYEEIDKFYETRGNSDMIEQTHKGGYEYTECPAYAPNKIPPAKKK